MSEEIINVEDKGEEQTKRRTRGILEKDDKVKEIFLKKVKLFQDNQAKDSDEEEDDEDDEDEDDEDEEDDDEDDDDEDEEDDDEDDDEDDEDEDGYDEDEEEEDEDEDDDFALHSRLLNRQRTVGPEPSITLDAFKQHMWNQLAWDNVRKGVFYRSDIEDSLDKYITNSKLPTGCGIKKLIGEYIENQNYDLQIKWNGFEGESCECTVCRDKCKKNATLETRDDEISHPMCSHCYERLDIIIDTVKQMKAAATSTDRKPETIANSWAKFRDLLDVIDADE
jgi:hypothetical protein